MTFELGAGGFECFAEFAEVVNLAVEDDPIARDWIVHRLVPERRKVNDGEASVGEPDLLVSHVEENGAGIVGAAMGETALRFRKKVGGQGRSAGHDTKNSTHGF